MKDDFYNIKWTEQGLKAIDQRKLPEETVYLLLTNQTEVYEAIQTMAIRGAGVLSIAAAYGVYLGVWKTTFGNAAAARDGIIATAEWMRNCRPTAVSLSVVMDQVIETAKANGTLPPEEQKAALLQRCDELARLSAECDRKVGENALPLFHDGDTVITHCNTGIYASIGIGSATAPMYLGQERGIHLKVYADETRPVLQGSRLTAHELQRAGIDVTVICDNMAGYLMQQGKIDAVIVGCDRIAANGDVVNKIGTYSLAVLAKHHGIPFYVAGAFADIDYTVSTGKEIPIEQRPAGEVTEFLGKRTAPVGVKVYNPCFDVTPHELVTALILDTGVVRAPDHDKLRKLSELEV